MTDLIIAILTTYGIVTIVTESDGLFNIFYKLRGVKNEQLNKLFSCSMCMSVYIAVLPTVGLGLNLWEYLATIGGTILLTRVEW